jgi:hypothetical protein
VSGSATEVIMDEVTSAENYPGGVMAYSQAFNEMLERFGIAIKTPSMLDSWFQPRTQDNRALLAMTVGDINKIKLQKPEDVMKELGVRNISLPSFNEIDKLITNARLRQAIPSEVDSKLTIADLIQAEVLANAPKK